MSLEYTPFMPDGHRRAPAGTREQALRRTCRTRRLPHVDVLQGARRMLVASASADGRLRLGLHRERRGSPHRRRPLLAG